MTLGTIAQFFHFVAEEKKKKRKKKKDDKKTKVFYDWANRYPSNSVLVQNCFL